MEPTIAVEVTRADRLESVHRVHAVIVRADGGIDRVWGDGMRAIYPRSASKMIQALPLVESGAATDLTPAHLALACASHSGMAIHTETVMRWLSDIGRGESDLRCGPLRPLSQDAADDLTRSGQTPCQIHNNCSGKHTGFLTYSGHVGAGPEYNEIDHPVQQAILEAWADVTQEVSPGFGIDGCSAPNHVTTLTGLARAMASFADGTRGRARGVRAQAQRRLVEAMMAHPELVAGAGRACTGLMEAMAGRGAVKTGAEGVFIGIVPEQGIGIALKAECGTTRAAEAAMTALLAHVGVLDPEDPRARSWNGATLHNAAGKTVGEIRARLS